MKNRSICFRRARGENRNTRVLGGRLCVGHRDISNLDIFLLATSVRLCLSFAVRGLPLQSSLRTGLTQSRTVPWTPSCHHQRSSRVPWRERLRRLASAQCNLQRAMLASQAAYDWQLATTNLRLDPTQAQATPHQAMQPAAIPILYQQLPPPTGQPASSQTLVISSLQV